MLGVILAGGTGSRLMPLTTSISKHLLPVYNKPMIYYPISTLMLAGVREILLVVNPQDEVLYRTLLGDGSSWGLLITYVEQETPGGLADALLAAEPHIKEGPFAVILGDNVFYGAGVGRSLQNHFQEGCATIFAQPVSDPRRYGIVELTPEGIPISLEEKPSHPSSDLAVPGLYFYDSSAFERVRTLSPSQRGELEITDLNKSYLSDKRLKVIRFPRGTAWLDAGTLESLFQASEFIRAVEERQGILVSSPEEIAWRQGWVSASDLAQMSADHKGTRYGELLGSLSRSER